jgi:ribonuclease HII
MSVPPSAPDRFAPEREAFARGLTRLAGVDEAGRGPLAGPVVAAAVILPSDWVRQGIPAELADLNDSKQVTETRREELFARLTGWPGVEFAISESSPEEIDLWNILEATHRAMNAALHQLQPAPVHVLVDGLRVPSLCLPQTPLVKGDARSYSIAAASILAKVTRDRSLLAAHARWPEYGFDRHKGYPTAAHLKALTEHGPCPIHRRSFAPLRPTQPELFPP